ncbi:cysteine-S-conjugate beta-lyase OS=Streptomyces tendae OX=1932 GN=GUR47_06285 PE=3 SV=1 [Streptomyces tendae]
MTPHSSPATWTPEPASAPYDFDTPVDRRGTWCTQWDYVQDRFGVPDLLPFTISDMDFETAPEVLAALRGRLEHGVLGYSRWRQDDFLSAVVHWYASRHGTDVDPGSVVYAPSVVYQVSQLLRLWSRPGDGVVAHTPMYDAFPKTVSANGRRLLECPLDDWAELERLLALPDTAVLLLCSPHNPTGRVWSAGELDRMARLCARHRRAVAATRSTPTWRTPRRPPPRGCGTAATAGWAVVDFGVQVLQHPGADRQLRDHRRPGLARRLPAAAQGRRRTVLPAVLSLVGHIAAYREGAPWLDALRTFSAGNLAVASDRRQQPVAGSTAGLRRRAHPAVRRPAPARRRRASCHASRRGARRRDGRAGTRPRWRGTRG